MTVAELIEKLQQEDPDAVVVVSDGQGGLDPVSDFLPSAAYPDGVWIV